MRLVDLLKKPDSSLTSVLKYGKIPEELGDEDMRHIEAVVKYDGYIRKQEKEISQAAKADRIKIPAYMEFGRVPGLSREPAEKLDSYRPATLGDARRIPGMTPAAVHNLALYLEIQRRRGDRRAGVPRETNVADE